MSEHETSDKLEDSRRQSREPATWGDIALVVLVYFFVSGWWWMLPAIVLLSVIIHYC